MEVKEAADLLDNLVGMVEDSHGADYDTALRMAINALSAQPDHSGDVNGKVDLIDRQAAIDAIRTKYCPSDFMDDGVIDAFAEIIQDLPSAQPEIIACGQGELVQDGSRLVQDCISRQAAIDYCYALINAENPSDPSDEWNYSQERINQTEVILHHLEFMPSAQPEPDTALYVEGFNDGYKQGKNDAQSDVARDIATIIENEKDMRVMLQPEIIHCGDCEYKDDGIDEDGIQFLKCLHGRSYGGTRINDYCSWAERRADETTI